MPIFQAFYTTDSFFIIWFSRVVLTNRCTALIIFSTNRLRIFTVTIISAFLAGPIFNTKLVRRTIIYTM
jgi:hypothetical protein